MSRPTRTTDKRLSHKRERRAGLALIQRETAEARHEPTAIRPLPRVTLLPASRANRMAPQLRR